jgi:hypothetical protein
VGEVGLDISDDVSCDRRPAVKVDACSGFEAIIKDSLEISKNLAENNHAMI